MLPHVNNRVNMKPNRTTTGLLLLVVLAFFGGLLVVVPSKILDQYEVVRQAGPPWTYAYFSAVGVGGALLLISTLTIIWRLWRRTRGKRQRQQLRNKSPSQLTAGEQDREVDENLASVKDFQSDPATSVSTFSRSGKSAATSSVCSPIDPVEPKIASRRG